MRKFNYIIVLLFISIAGYAGIVPIGTARKVAVNFYFERANALKPVSKESVKISQEFTELQDVNPAFYIFNIGLDNGYVIVSAESNTIPVFAYSFEKNYDSENNSPAYKGLLNSYKTEIIACREKSLFATDEINALWAEYTKTDFKSATSVSAVAPLLGNMIWDQGCYYNALCPVDVDPGYCNHVPTGCVATAMAMIMKYHAWPAQGQGSYSYAHTIANGFSNDYGTLSANFGTSTYNWTAMPVDVTSANAEVAKLMYQCGIAVEMEYDINGSGSLIGVPAGYSNPSAQKALVNYFKYPNAAYFEKVNFTDAAWKAKIKTDIDASRPIIYAGDGSLGGHAFVLDGYQGTGNDYFHFNFGWGGYNNGYFYITSINSGNGDFTSNQEGVFGISKTATCIEDDKNISSVEIYPNPSNGLVTLNLSKNADLKAKLEVYNLMGEIVYNTTINKDNTNLDLSFLSKGIYYLSLKTINTTITKKITLVK